MSVPRFLVVVFPPVVREPRGGGSYTVAEPHTVKRVRADTPQAAAASVGVPPGGYALVAAESDIRRFDRAVQAPLHEHDPDGQPLPQVEAVSS